MNNTKSILEQELNQRIGQIVTRMYDRDSKGTGGILASYEFFENEEGDEITLHLKHCVTHFGDSGAYLSGKGGAMSVRVADFLPPTRKRRNVQVHTEWPPRTRIPAESTKLLEKPAPPPPLKLGPASEALAFRADGYGRSTTLIRKPKGRERYEPHCPHPPYPAHLGVQVGGRGSLRLPLQTEDGEGRDFYFTWRDGDIRSATREQATHAARQVGHRVVLFSGEKREPLLVAALGEEPRCGGLRWCVGIDESFDGPRFGGTLGPVMPAGLRPIILSFDGGPEHDPVKAEEASTAAFLEKLVADENNRSREQKPGDGE